MAAAPLLLCTGVRELIAPPARGCMRLGGAKFLSGSATPSSFPACCSCCAISTGAVRSARHAGGATACPLSWPIALHGGLDYVDGPVAADQPALGGPGQTTRATGPGRQVYSSREDPGIAGRTTVRRSDERRRWEVCSACAQRTARAVPSITSTRRARSSADVRPTSLAIAGGAAARARSAEERV